MNNFAGQVNEVVFMNLVKEYDITKNGAYIEAVTRINNTEIKKIAKKLYMKFSTIIDYESFINEFQTQVWFASKTFEDKEKELVLQQIINDLNNNITTESATKQFYKFVMNYAHHKMFDEYLRMDNEELTNELRDEEYYDNYFEGLAEETTNPIKEWYFENKDKILTESQLEFIKKLNTNTLNNSDKAHKARVIKSIKNRILKAYEKIFSL